MLTSANPRSTDAELFDQRALVAELDQLAQQHGNNEQALRRAITQPLKAALAAGRTNAERLLLQDRQGRRCAERLCEMQDRLIRVIYEFVGRHLYPSQNPSEAERMAIIATGGYGRGLMAPG